MKQALNTVITELTILSSRLTPRWRDKVDACITLLQAKLNEGTPDPDPLRITTLLSYDPQANMAYLYLSTPAECHGAAHVTKPQTFGIPEYTALVDYAEDGRALGAEFPAATKEEALERAADVFGNIG